MPADDEHYRISKDAAPVPGARRARLPASVPRPELATLAKSPPGGDDWLHELKLDGYRILCRVEDGAVQLVSRNGNDWTRRFPSVVRAAETMPARAALLDGEVVVLLPDGKSSFQALQNALSGKRGGNIVYFAFDLIHLDGHDLAGARLEDRKRALESLLADFGSATAIRYSAHVVGRGDAFFREVCRLGVEGMVSKRRAAHYVNGRTRDWLKIKCIARQEVVIGGFTEPSGARTGIGALLVGVHDEMGALTYAGKVGTGFTAASLRDLERRLAPIERSTSPFANAVPRGGRFHWVEPKLVAEVAFSEWTDGGRLRHPSFQGLREDKPAKDVVRETPR